MILRLLLPHKRFFASLVFTTVATALHRLADSHVATPGIFRFLPPTPDCPTFLVALPLYISECRPNVIYL